MGLSTDFAEKIEKIRNEKEITQSQIATKMGVTQGAVNNYLKGRPVDLDTAKALADAVGADFLSLLSGAPAPAGESQHWRAADSAHAPALDAAIDQVTEALGLLKKLDLSLLRRLAALDDEELTRFRGYLEQQEEAKREVEAERVETEGKKRKK